MSEPPGRIETERIGGHAVIRIIGEVDASNSDEIFRDLENATSEPLDRYFIDLAHTRFVDSSGMRVLFMLANRLKPRHIELHAIIPEAAIVRRVLELSGFFAAVPVHETLPD